MFLLFSSYLSQFFSKQNKNRNFTWDNVYFIFIWSSLFKFQNEPLDGVNVSWSFQSRVMLFCTWPMKMWRRQFLSLTFVIKKLMMQLISKWTVKHWLVNESNRYSLWSSLNNECLFYVFFLEIFYMLNWILNFILNYDCIIYNKKYIYIYL